MSYYFYFFIACLAQYLPNWCDTLMRFKEWYRKWVPNVYIWHLIEDIISSIHVPTLVGMLVLCCIALLYLYWNRTVAPAVPPFFLRKAYFTYHFQQFYSIYFCRQHPATKLAIERSVEEMLDGDCSYASVLSLLVPVKGGRTAKTLAQLVAWSTYSAFVYPHVKKPAYEKLVIEGTDFSSYYHHSALLERTMKQIIRNYRVVIINNFQAIDPRCGAIVRKVADIGDDPYMQVLVILIVNVAKPNITEAMMRDHNAGEIMELFFLSHWSHILDEGPLQEVTRMMGKYAVMLQREPGPILKDAREKLHNPDFAYEE